MSSHFEMSVRSSAVSTDDGGEMSGDDNRDAVTVSMGNCVKCIECGSRAQAANHLAFWLLGLCNNFGYVVFLTGAHDILKAEEGTSNESPTTSPTNSTVGCVPQGLQCNKNSTGIILLADILPTLLIKLTAPYYMHSIRYKYRVAICVLFALLSYIVVAVSHAVWLSVLGVVFASISAGLGEITFLSLTSHFFPTTVSYWSSGTGAAGAVGAWSYLGLRYLLSARDTLLAMMCMPILMAVSYWGILQKPHTVSLPAETAGLLSDVDDNVDMADDDDGIEESSDKSGLPKKRRQKRAPYPGARIAKLPLVVKLRLLRPLLKYMVPLFFVYYGEYLINQGLYEVMIWRDCIWVEPDEQYRWLQALYQIGVFVSRSSVQIFPVKKIWLLSLLQWVNVAILFLESYLHIFPSIYLSFAFAFYEGLLGGGCYVNAFYRIREEVEPENCEFSLGVASMADSLGISFAGVSAIPVHKYLCAAMKGKL